MLTEEGIWLPLVHQLYFRSSREPGTACDTGASTRRVGVPERRAVVGEMVLQGPPFPKAVAVWIGEGVEGRVEGACVLLSSLKGGRFVCPVNLLHVCNFLLADVVIDQAFWVPKLHILIEEGRICHAHHLVLLGRVHQERGCEQVPPKKLPFQATIRVCGEGMKLSVQVDSKVVVA
eukprot:2693336-Rhodomonas_salina.1